MSRNVPSAAAAHPVTRWLGATLLASTLLASGAAAAAPPSSDQLVCDLTGECGGTHAAAPTLDKPETRGFSIARVGVTPASAAVHVASMPAASVAAPSAARPVHIAAPRPQPSAPGALAPRFGVGRSQLSLDFLSGSSSLSDTDKAQADTFFGALQNPAMTGKRFLISGHTSAVGSRASNLDLSQRRAQAVVDYLVSKGADRNLFDVKGFGFDQPLSGTSPASPANRRVDITKLN